MFIHTCLASKNYSIMCVLWGVGLENAMSSDLAPTYAPGWIFLGPVLRVHQVGDCPCCPQWSMTPNTISLEEQLPLGLWVSSLWHTAGDIMIQYFSTHVPGRWNQRGRLGQHWMNFTSYLPCANVSEPHVDGNRSGSHTLNGESCLTPLRAAPTLCHQEKNESITPLRTTSLPKSVAGVRKLPLFLNSGSENKLG